jgi:2-methylisocitrate lyase-like PEP mutase family enzyme
MRALLASPGLHVMPAIWDGLTARLVARAGFKTAFLSGSCVAASRLAGPDLDLISFAEMLDSLHQACAATPDLPLLADGDHGYGNAMNVQRTMRAYARAGAACVLIEDKLTPRPLTASGKPCLPRAEAVMKVRAAIEAARESGILVLARTDCRPTQGIDEAVARIEEFAAAGADLLYLDSPADEAEMTRGIRAAGGKPSLCVLAPGSKRATPSRARAAELGFRIAVYPAALLGASTAALQAACAALAAGDAPVAGALAQPELQAVLGYAEYEAEAKRFRPAG